MMKDEYTVTYETKEGLTVQLTGDFDEIRSYMQSKLVAPVDVPRLETDRKKAAALTLLLNDYEAGADGEDFLHNIKLAYDMFRGDE